MQKQHKKIIVVPEEDLSWAGLASKSHKVRKALGENRLQV